MQPVKRGVVWCGVPACIHRDADAEERNGRERPTMPGWDMVTAAAVVMMTWLNAASKGNHPRCVIIVTIHKPRVKRGALAFER